MRQLRLICILMVVLAQPALSKPWSNGGPPIEPYLPEPVVVVQQQPQPQQPQQPQQFQELAIKEPQQQQQQQDAEDDYLFLSDDELVHNKKVLRKLKLVNPKDADELIDNNPVLEALILKRLEAKLAKESMFPIKKVYGYPGVVHHQHQLNHHHHHDYQPLPVQPLPVQQLQQPVKTIQQQQEQEYLEDLDAEQDEHEELDHEHVVYDKKKYDSWKEKLKTKAGKIFKMGSGFKEKYWALRKKYDKVPKESYVALELQPKTKIKVIEKDKEFHKHKIPKFHVVEVSSH